VSTVFRLVGKTNPQQCLEIREDRFLIGRSLECDLVIPERHVSRVQAQVSFENGRHFVKNVGRNPLRINGRASRGDFLKTGDEIAFGALHYQYQADLAPAALSSEAQTQIAGDAAALAAESERRLVCTLPDGTAATYLLKGTRTVIGRSQEADVMLEDSAVSRRHCVIELREGAFHARNISASNPLRVNGFPVADQRLYSGDQLGIGRWTVTFLSGLAEDARPGRLAGSSRLLLWAAALLGAVLAGYAAFDVAVVPWMNRQAIGRVAAELEAGDHDVARGRLLLLLAGPLSPEQAAEVRRLLNEAALGLAAEKARHVGPEDAAAFLKTHLAEHGSARESAAVWDRLNQYRIELGRRLESSDPQRALGVYAAVPEDSPQFAEARSAIHRVWQNFQKRSFQQQTVAQLLRDAEAHFAAGRLLTPVHRNAYSAYQAVLAIEPHNETALRRIEQIRQHYRSEGEAQFRAGHWDKALSYLEAFILLEPDALDVRAKIARCHQRLAAAAEPAPHPRPSAAPFDSEEQERVRRMLQESGAEGAWIMKYLFQEKNVESDSETPW
jgi:pSer/pThr/pTyr-binding forkhead associated (FHA) protein/tetratricopeptide (TPR) repeat protein